MSASIELGDLHKPFYELETQPKHQRPASAYAYVAIEAFVTLTVYYKYDYLTTLYRPLGAACLGAATAALAQSFNQLLKYKFSDSRLLKFIVWGAINGLFTALWLDVLLTQVPTLVLRIVLDQTVGAPLFQLTYTVLSTTWDGESVPSPTMSSVFLRSLRYSYCFWPFVSIATFTVVAPERMVICNCVASFIWNVILSRLS